jgi:CRP-like cAMP-binding protein
MVNTRQTKIYWLKNALSSFFKQYPDKVVDKNKLIANFVLEFNTTRRTAVEILKNFHDAGLIILDGNYIKKGDLE